MSKKIIIKILASTTIEKVWAAWTNPEYIVKWNFAYSD